MEATDLDDDGDTPDHARALASHHGFVRELARGLVAPGAFEDVAHEALLAGLARPPDRPAALRGWLATTVRNLASKWQRGEARRARREVAAARPEALPSARELVERIELEQAVVRAVLALREPFRTTVLLRFYEGHSTAAIAQQLRLPADTVRARLRRGLAELRVQLDARFGTRNHWIAALLPVAALPTRVAAKAAAAATATGAAVMGLKSISIVAASCATAAFAWWAVPESWVERVLAPAGPNVAPVAAAAAPGIGGAHVAASGAGGDALSATRAAEGAAVPGGKPAGDESLPPPGTVLLEVVDAHTLAPLDGVKIRFLNEARFAEYGGSGSVQTELTAGHWEANVAAEGYEPARLAGFDVAIGEAHVLGRVALERGNGVVEGRVVALHLPSDVPVTIELFGNGRSPCDRCLAALNHRGIAGDDEEVLRKFGADCFFGKDRDVVAAAGDRSFRFGHLAAGTYWLRASDEKQRIVAARKIELGRGGTTWQELDVSAPTFARFELRHAHGGLFSGAWSNPHRPQPAAIHYEFRRGGAPVGTVEFTPSVDDTLASVGPPITIPGGNAEPNSAELAAETLADEIQVSETFQRVVLPVIAVKFASLSEGTWLQRPVGESLDAASAPERLDRERQEGDALAFDFDEPGCDGVELALEKIRPDLHEVRPLPRLELTIVVACGDYVSDELPLDLRADDFQPLVVTMHPTTRSAGHLAGTATTSMCATCHSETPPQALPDLPIFWQKRAAQVDLLERLDAREALDRARDR